MSISPVLADASVLRILLVDDEPSILDVFGALLELDGHRVGMAADGAAALALFQAEPWDVVVTDRAMPRMNGLELADAIKQLSPCTPVILMTGLVTESSASLDALMQKPFTFEKLAKTISTCLADTGPVPLAVVAP